MKWQEIETVPKDGTLIDVWVKSSDLGGRIVNVQYHEKSELGLFNISGLYSYDQYLDYHIPIKNATHWMPLPEPPNKY